MTENNIETISIFGILSIACSFKIRKADFFTFRPKSSKGHKIFSVTAVSQFRTKRWNSFEIIELQFFRVL